MRAVRHGFRIIGNALFFEDIRIAGLDDIPGLYSSAKGRLIELVDGIEGVADPASETEALRNQVRDMAEEVQTAILSGDG